MYRQILLTLDGSERARGSILHARELAASAGTEVVLLRVVDTGAPATRDEAAQELEQAEAQLRAAGVGSVTAVVAEGEPGPVIVEQAERLGTQAVVMTTRGQSNRLDEVLGSVAEYVLQHIETAAIVLVGPTANRVLIDAAIEETSGWPARAEALDRGQQASRRVAVEPRSAHASDVSIGERGTSDLPATLRELIEAIERQEPKDSERAGPISYVTASALDALRVCDVCAAPIVEVDMLVQRLLERYQASEDQRQQLENAIRASGLETGDPLSPNYCSYHAQITSE